MKNRLVILFILFLSIHFGVMRGNGPEECSDSTVDQHVLVYWDTSLSMAGRNLEMELDFLSAYLESLGSTRLEVVTFDHKPGKSREFLVEQGDLSAVSSLLEEITYDGSALFEGLKLEEAADAILIFSDGVGVLDDLTIPEGKDIYLVNSLNLLDFQGRRNEHINYLNLMMIGVTGALERLGIETPETVADLTGTDPAEAAMSDIPIEGVVFDQRLPLENVAIQVKGKDEGVVSGKNGEFRLNASIGDVLVIGYLGMENQEYQILGNQFIQLYLNVEMNQLEEVVLKSSIQDSESDNTIQTAFGAKSENQVGYTVQTIDDDAFEGQANISDATRGRIISSNYSQNDDISQIQLRQVQTFGAGTKNPLIVIDDVPLGVNNSASGGLTLSTYHIDPNNVEEIVVLRGLAATNKYGTLARGGAILIYTKTRVGAKLTKEEPTNSAMLRGNVYNENVTSVKTSSSGDYMKDFRKAKTAGEAFELYMTQRDSHLDDFQFFVEVSKYMLKWGDPDVSKRILLNILELNPGQTTYLRYAGMLLQDRKDFNLTQRIYERILVLAPQESQSYRDLALSLSHAHQYQKSLEVYRKMKEGSYAGVNFEGLQKPLNSEMKRLILAHRNKMDTQGLPSHYFTPLNYDVRVVIDYNDRDIEFNLQFVNPKKKFFVWSHRKFEDAQRIQKEKQQGFNSEEFFLVDAEPGKWQINIESPKQDSRKPLAIRYTVFRNYGSKAETSQSKTLLLNDIEGKYLLGIIKI